MDNTNGLQVSQEQMTRADALAKEARMYRESIDMNMYQLARVFAEAKELIPHGNWEKWLRDNADVSVRTAQDMIAAYRRFGDRPIFDSVGRSKLFKLLALPEGTEEEFAREHDLKGMSSREVDAAVKAAREEARKELEAEKAARIAAEKRAEEAENAPAVIPEELVDELRKSKEKAQRAEEELGRLAEAEKEILDEKNRLNQENARLTREAREKDELLDEQQDEYNRLQAEILHLRSTAARGEYDGAGAEKLTPEALGQAVRQFMGAVARLPLMGASLSKLDETDRHEVELMIGTVEKWARESREALNTVVLSGEVVA